MLWNGEKMIEIEVWWYGIEAFRLIKPILMSKMASDIRFLLKAAEHKKIWKIDFLEILWNGEKMIEIEVWWYGIEAFRSIKPILMSKMASDARFLIETAENEKISKFLFITGPKIINYFSY